jgi:hypothetical protein
MVLNRFIYGGEGVVLLILDSKSFITNFKTQLVGLITGVWYGLRSPRFTLLLLALLGVVWLISWWLPQQIISTNPETVRSAWVASLPPLVQVWGNLLFSLGLAQIRQSIWFWLPLALLWLNGLLALADYLPGAWQRQRPTLPTLNWQHPLARRVEFSARLPESPDQFLNQLQTTLAEQHFFIYQPNPTDPRLIGAARRRYGWLSPAMGYAGLVTLVLALLASHYFWQADRFFLWPLQPIKSPLFNHTLTLTGVEAARQSGQISVDSAQAEAGLLTWQLYQPSLFAKALVIPLALKPLLTVEARDANGALLRLIPAQENLGPADRLHLSLNPTNQPLYFSIPAQGLAFQLTPESAAPENVRVRVRHTGQLSAAQEIKAIVGQNFGLGGLTFTITPNFGMDVWVYRDAAWPLYLISFSLMITGSAFFWWHKPVQFWLVAEAKGRGGQLYGIVEKFGPVDDATQFFEAMLADTLAKEEKTPHLS